MEPTDYTGNTKKEKDKDKGDKDKEKPKKEIQKIVTVPVLVKKKGIGKRIKEAIIEADFKSVITYVVSDILIPAAKSMIVDSVSRGTERMFFPDSRRRGVMGQGSRISYSGISRTIGGSPLRSAPSIERGPRSTRQSRDEFIIPSRKEAEEILELMNDIIDNYDVVTISDFNEMVDQPSSHVDQKWGWTFLGDVQILQVRGGYLVDLPPAEPIQ